MSFDGLPAMDDAYPECREVPSWSGGRRGHVIADVRFEPKVPSELAPLICECGWDGPAGEFVRHRREVDAEKVRHGRKPSMGTSFP